MVLTGGAGWLHRVGFARPHVFLLALPGGTAVRLAGERHAHRRGWPLAESPADADVLVVCGQPSTAGREVVERFWGQLPPPRARLDTSDEREVPAALDDAAARLRTGRQRRARSPSSGGHDDHSDHGDRGGHEGMEMPGGLDMAGRAPDRDGLQLDVLHPPLGPALTLWPAGLALHLTLQGDVIQDVEVTTGYGVAGAQRFWERPWLRCLAGEPVPVAEAERHRAAAHLDSLYRLLALAGWDGAALRCARLRDDLLTGMAPEAAASRFATLARRLRRARLLRWMTAGIGVVDGQFAAGHGIGGPALRAAGVVAGARRGSGSYPGFVPPRASGSGDVTARYLQWLAEIETALDAARRSPGRLEPAGGRLEGPRGSLGGPQPPSQPLVELLPRLLVGTELAAARLIVASLDPDTDSLAAPAPAEAPNG